MEEVVEQTVPSPELSDEAIREIAQRRFQQRVNRVLAVMKEEGVDFRGMAVITADGRIGVRVAPVEMGQG